MKIEVNIQVMITTKRSKINVFSFISFSDDRSGSTAISCLIDPERVYFLNVGDSRGILVSTAGRVLLATKDHKPSRLKSLKIFSFVIEKYVRWFSFR